MENKDKLAVFLIDVLKGEINFSKVIDSYSRKREVLIMKEKLLKLHEKLSINEQQICETKIRISNLEAEKDKKEKKLQIKTKEEWKALGITNETGRKAYIKDQLIENYEQIHNKNIILLHLQTDQKILVRTYKLYLEFYKTENITHYK